MKYFISSIQTLEADDEFAIEQTSKEHIEEWLDLYASNESDIIEIDTETRSRFNDFSGTVLTFQVGNPEDQFVLDAADPLLFPVIERILNSDCVKILQNAAYDLKWFLKWGINPTNIYDTMLSEIVLNCGYDIGEVGVALDDLGKKYLNVDISKEVRGKIGTLGIVPKVVNYAATDVEYLTKIRELQIKKANSLDLLNVINLENEVVRVVAEMEYNGIKLDPVKWMEINTHHSIEAKRKEKIVQDYMIEKNLGKKYSRQFDIFNNVTLGKLNLNSPTQIVEILNQIGKEKNNKELKQLDTSSEKIIEKFAYLDDFIGLYLDFKEEKSTVSKYGKKFLNNVNIYTGRVHPEFWQIVDTGRFSCRNPNLQNIKTGSKHRNAFVPKPGYKFVGADFSSQELVLIAEDSKEPIWVEATLNNWDLHSYVAEMVFKDKWKQATEPDCKFKHTKQKCSCKEHKKQRDKIKTINYALAYGAGYNKIAANLRISPNEAKNLIAEYFGTMKRLEVHFNTLSHYSKTNLVMRTFKPFRRARFFSPPREDNYDNDLHSIGRQGMNSRFQGTGADMMKLAMVNLVKHMNNVYPKGSVLPILQVHDEFLFEVREDLAQQVLNDQIEIMTETSKVFLKTLVVNAEGSVMDYWTK